MKKSRISSFFSWKESFLRSPSILPFFFFSLRLLGKGLESFRVFERIFYQPSLIIRGIEIFSQQYGNTAIKRRSKRMCLQTTFLVLQLMEPIKVQSKFNSYNLKIYISLHRSIFFLFSISSFWLSSYLLLY